MTPLRTYFRTCRLHSCHSQELHEPLPKKCPCRKMVSMREAVTLVETGECDWLIDYSGKWAKHSWDLVYKNRVNKTPRAHTLESCNPSRAPHSFGQIERCIDRSMSDGGSCMNWIERHLDGEEKDEEETWLFEEYHRIEIESRYRLFGWPAGPELQKLKEFSDTLGTCTGSRAQIIDSEISKIATMIKQREMKEDEFKGCPVLAYIGTDQRTNKRK